MIRPWRVAVLLLVPMGDHLSFLPHRNDKPTGALPSGISYPPRTSRAGSHSRDITIPRGHTCPRTGCNSNGKGHWMDSASSHRVRTRVPRTTLEVLGGAKMAPFVFPGLGAASRRAQTSRRAAACAPVNRAPRHQRRSAAPQSRLLRRRDGRMLRSSSRRRVVRSQYRNSG